LEVYSAQAYHARLNELFSGKTYRFILVHVHQKHRIPFFEKTAPAGTPLEHQYSIYDRPHPGALAPPGHSDFAALPLISEGRASRSAFHRRALERRATDSVPAF
jgi:hypothetical protein